MQHSRTHRLFIPHGIMDGQIDKMEKRYSMTKLENRLRTFQDGVALEKKKLKWSFKVIPYQAMAKLGFYFDPVIDPKTSKLKKDSVRCCYCHRQTYNVRDCRSKRKDVLETLSNIMRQHLTVTDNKQVCLLIYLRNKLLTDYSFHMGVSDWKNDKYFSNPDDENVINLRKFTFQDNWPHSGSQNEHPLGIEKMVNAGLMRYDSSIEGLGDPSMDKTLMNDTCYCIYCKQLLQGWSINDDPMSRHYKVSQNGNCYFFQTRNRFERIKNDNDSITKNCEVSPTLGENGKREVINTKTASQRQCPLFESPPSSTGPQLDDYNEKTDISVIQHNISVLDGAQGENVKRNSVEEKEQINMENGSTTLEEGNINRDVLADKKEVISTPTAKETKRPNVQLTQSSSPIKKKRKFKRISPRKIFDEEDSEHSLNNNSANGDNKDKDLVIDFTSHIIKNRDVGRKNAILDDSTDEFSFSNQGHNTFDIPIPTSSHLLKGIDSDNDNAIREDDTGINTDTKGASSKHEKFSVNSEEDLNFSEGKLTGRDSSTNILIRTQIVDQNLGDIDRDKVPNGGSPEVPKTHELIRDNSEKREAQNGEFRHQKDSTVRQSPDILHSDKSGDNSSNITAIPKEEQRRGNSKTSSIPADIHPKPRKNLQEPRSLSISGKVVPTERKLDNINIDLNFSASDFSPSSQSEQSSKSSSVISTPVASPKINLTRSLHAVKELSGLKKETDDDKYFTNKQETIKILEDASVKNETPNNEMLLFETGTPIASQENKSRKLFDEEFSGKELDMPIDSSTVEIKKVIKPEFEPVPSVARNLVSGTSSYPRNSRLEEQRKETSTSLADNSKKGSSFNEGNNEKEPNAAEWFKIDENRHLVKNYFHDLLKYINNNDATLANDKDGDLAFLIKQMPAEELDMTFNNWVNLKVQSIKREFIDDCDKKLDILRRDYYTATNFIETLEDDNQLIDIAKKMGIL